MRTENEMYQEWLSKQPALKVGEVYVLLHAINRVSTEGLWELKLNRFKGDECEMTMNDGTPVVMHKHMVMFKIYNGQKL